MPYKDKISQWLKDGNIKEEIISPKDIVRLIHRAKKNVQSAKDNLKLDEELSFMAAYLAVLRTGRAFMFAHGYRPASSSHHKITFEFAKIVLGHSLDLLLAKIDDFRKRRNQCTYDVDYIDSISEEETTACISDASLFIEAVSDFLKKRWPSDDDYKKL